MSILEVKSLNKKFGKKQILKNVTFDMDKGDIVAFIGPNGAGKTTTIKCILGLQKIDSGTVLIDSYDVKKDFVHAISKVGCIVESPDVYMYMSGYENLKMQASYYKNIENEDIDKIVDLVGLTSRIKDKVSKYSLGMRQRLGIGISLLNHPKLLILDEPTNGLDPEGIRELRELLKKLASEGMAILISSHNLSELESFCNKVLIIRDGEIIEENNMNLMKEEDSNRYRFKVSNTSKLKELLKSDDKIEDEHYFEVMRSEEEIAELIKKLVKNKIDIYEVGKENKSLEEVFIKKAGGSKK